MRFLWSSLALGALAGCSVYEPPAGSPHDPPDADTGPVSAGAGGASTGEGTPTATTGGAAGEGGGAAGEGGASTVAGTGGGAGSAPEGGGGAGASGGSAGGKSDASDAAVMVVDAVVDITAERRDDAGPPAVGLPFAVDSYFVPTGYMGDGVHPGALVVESAGCKLPRPAGARGNCYRVTYRPQPPTTAGNPAWAGVYWLAPQDNWGEKPGRRIQPGATAVTFYAAGAAGGESVSFRAGGVQNATFPYQDTFRVEQTFPLTTTMTQYTLDLTGQTYDAVIGGFAWVLVTFDAATWAAGAPPIVFYLDDIEWPR